MKTFTLSHDEIGLLCRELAQLLHAGIGPGDALALLTEDESLPEYCQMLKSMSRQADDGLPLSEIFRSAGLPGYAVGLLAVGERAGRLEESLSALAAHYDSRARLERHLRSALLYPALLLLIMLAVIVILLIWVLPVFDDVYRQLGSGLTGVAGGLLAFGQALKGALPVLCVLLGAACAACVLFAAVPALREKALGLWRRHFGDRGVSRKINTARFAQSLSMGLRSGLPLDEAITLSAGLSGGIPGFEARCKDCLSRLDAGAGVAQALGEAGLLPHAECRLLDAGLRGGAGDAAIEHIAGRLLEESEAALEARVSQVEPALVVVTSILVGFILLSVMLPLTNIMSAIG